MKIALGSTNPGKLVAVRNAIKKVWPKARVISIDVDSGVGHTPISHNEVIEGASNRAKLCVEKTGADLGIGIEGFILDTKKRMFTGDWAVAINREGVLGLGLGGMVLVPERVANDVRKGKELTIVLDELFNDKNIGRKYGGVGVFTNKIITRRETMEKAVLYALARFITPQYYK